MTRSAQLCIDATSQYISPSIISSGFRVYTQLLTKNGDKMEYYKTFSNRLPLCQQSNCLNLITSKLFYLSKYDLFVSRNSKHFNTRLI